MFRLARELGCTVRELGERMGSDELVEWMGYSLIEPFGPPHEDFRAGTICQTLANINRNPETHPTPYAARDFFGSLRSHEETKPVPPPKLTPEQEAAALDAAFFGIAPTTKH